MTDAEFLLLGLVAEMPRHGYEIEQVIEQRGMREWTQIGFSSIYFVLGKLEQGGFVRAELAAGVKAKKTLSITPSGRKALMAETLGALANYRAGHSSVLLGMMHWPIVPRRRALSALRARHDGVAREIARLERIRYQSQPLPDHIESLFDFSTSQLEAELAWITETVDYMKTKP